MVGSMSYDPYDPWWSGPAARPAWIFDSYSTGDVTGNSIVGGLVGGLTNSTITNCYSTGSVSGNDDVGGLVGAIDPPPVIGLWGFTPDTISDFYPTENITGNSGVGQIVIRGFIHEVVNSFWDVETSGRATSAGGTGKTTAEMQTAATFLEAGWDFLDETENGTEHIWWIDEGQDYPRLWWQYGLAFYPYPQDDAIDVVRPVIINWLAGGSGLYHDIYFGKDEEAVANATTESPAIYQGRQPGNVTSYDPGKLELNTTYYWRIDEVDETDTNSPWKGEVWSFTTANFLVVDDFEIYNDIPEREPGSNRIYLAWISEHGATVGYPPPPPFSAEQIIVHSDKQWSSTKQTIVHSGNQSMPFFYDNIFGKSWATLTLIALRDWTIEGVKVSSIWFHGDPANDPEPMFVAIASSANQAATVYHDNPNAAQIEKWTEWRIELTRFADQGVDLTNVNSITLGFGNRDNPQPGGSGLVYFDDIRLYRSAP
jgi:hypothetical protein